MLLVKDVETDDILPLYIVDAHHHVGREKNVANRPSDVYLFFSRIESYIFSKFERMSPSELEKYRFIPLRTKPSLDLLTKLLGSIPSWQEANKGWMFEKAVIFPMNDIYAYTSDVAFEKSNRIMSNITTKLPDSLRLFGFARLDPHDSEKAVDAFKKSIIELGLRGLKLHPISQMFVDKLLDHEVVSLVQEAAYFDVPVIIDARFIATARRIKQLGLLVYEDRENNINKPKLIVAHCGRSFSNHELFYDVLSSELIFGETSTISGNDIPVFYKLASEILSDSNLENNWSSKIIFGTDSPFMAEVQAIEHILYLLSYDFYFKTGGDYYEIQQILGGNIMRLLDFPRILTLRSSIKARDCCLSFSISSDLFNEFLEWLRRTLIENKITLMSFDNFIAPHGVLIYDDIFLITLRENKENKIFGILFYINPERELYHLAIIEKFAPNFLKIADFKQNLAYELFSKSASVNSLREIEGFLIQNGK